MSGMEPTDEMVEAACAAFLVPSDEAARWPCDYDEEEQAAFRSYMRASITAALAVMPDQHRAGWIGGRDAAAEVAGRSPVHSRKPPRDTSSWAMGVEDAMIDIAAYIREQEPPA